MTGTGIKASNVYYLLHGLSRTAIYTVLIAEDSLAIQQNINLYLTRLSHARTALTGKDLQQMGIPPGPQMKQILEKLLHARLDGEVTNKQGEVEMVKNLNTR